VFDLAGDPAVEQRRIEGFNPRDAVAAFEQGLPGLLRGVANRGQKADTGNYNSAGNNGSPLTRLDLNATTCGHEAGRESTNSAHPIGCFNPPASDYFFLPSM
jgi:hypothetical protein